MNEKNKKHMMVTINVQTKMNMKKIIDANMTMTMNMKAIINDNMNEQKFHEECEEERQDEDKDEDEVEYNAAKGNAMLLNCLLSR
jgi:hypothetical protein